MCNLQKGRLYMLYNKTVDRVDMVVAIRNKGVTIVLRSTIMMNGMKIELNSFISTVAMLAVR